jgi:phage gp36-like protein
MAKRSDAITNRLVQYLTFLIVNSLNKKLHSFTGIRDDHSTRSVLLCQDFFYDRQEKVGLPVHQDLSFLNLFECGFEAIPDVPASQRYHLLLFSESFQYIPLLDIFSISPRLLRPGGQLLVCDFFKTDAHRDGGAGDRSFSGGHVLRAFYDDVSSSRFTLQYDEDLTARVSPNIALLDEWLMQRLLPASQSIDTYLTGRYPWSVRLLKWLTRRRLARLRYKYLSGNRSQAMFAKYKSYRLLVLRLEASEQGLAGN